MPLLSKKGQQMPASPIRKLVPYAETAKAAGKKVYHLNIGQPDIITHDILFKAIETADISVLAYSHSAGIESYRRKLSEYYRRHRIEVDYTDIMVTTGGSEAISFVMMSCLDPGDEVIVPEPFYANYNGFSLTSGAVVKPVTASIENDFALPPIADFETVITPKTKAILICNPSNPTGYLYTKEELEQLREIVLKHDLFLFVDEVYREFAYDGAKHFSVMELEGLEQHAVIVDSISKRFSACGARIGALVSRNKELMATALKFGQARLSPPTLGQIAGEAALDLPPTYFDEIVKEYQHRRDVLVEGLRAIPGVICPQPRGAFYVLAQLPIDDSERFCRWMLEDFDFEGATTMMAPGSGFYSTPGLGKKEVRIAYVLQADDLRNAIKCLAEGLKVYATTNMS